MSTKFSVNNISIEVKSISEDSKDWKVIQSEEYKPNRQDFLLNKFKNDFPSQAMAVDNFNTLSALASRSKRVNEWLALASAKYIMEVSTPLYLKEKVTPEQYTEANNAIKELNRNASERSKAEQEAANKYKDEMKRIDSYYNQKNKHLLSSKIIKILTLSPQSLPITLQLMIENFAPAKTSSSPDKRTYAREVLTQFKIALLDYFNNPKNADANLDEFLEGISEK